MITDKKDAIIISSNVETQENNGLQEPLKCSQKSLFLRAWVNIKGTRKAKKGEENMSRKWFKKIGAVGCRGSQTT